MQAALREKIEERHAELVGLQVRAIDLPDSFESRLVEIELKKQDAQKATEEILLAQINAETQKQLRELIAAKDKLRIQLEQETENLRLHILQNETEIKEVRLDCVGRVFTTLRPTVVAVQGTSRLLAALNAEKEEFLVLWAQVRSIAPPTLRVAWWLLTPCVASRKRKTWSWKYCTTRRCVGLCRIAAPHCACSDTHACLNCLPCTWPDHRSTNQRRGGGA